MFMRLLAGVLVLAAIGCAGPTLSSRMVEGAAARFVRLDTFTDTRLQAELRFSHPAELSEAELTAILFHVLVQEHVGLLERKPQPQALLSAADIKQLAPGLRKALQSAQPTEWAAFYTVAGDGGIQEVTSGGLFVKNGQLHVVIANYRERLPVGSDGPAAIRANPVHPWGGKTLALSFDPQRYVATTQSAWMGGRASAPASELVLNHSAYLADMHSAQQAPPAGAPPIPLPIPMATQRETTTGPPQVKDQLDALRDEVDRLRKRLEEQDEDIARLKTKLVELDTLIKNPPTKKPAR